MKIALFVFQNRNGGVERALLNLAVGFAEQGHVADLIVSDAHGPFMHEVPANVRLTAAGSFRSRDNQLALDRYVREHRPDAIITGKPSDDRFVLRAVQRARTTTRMIFGIGTALSVQSRHNPRLALRAAFKRWRRARLYARADAVVATSPWVAEDLLAHYGVDPTKLAIIGNPLVTPAWLAEAKMPVEHAFFRDTAPVLIAVGRLAPEKDFPTLLQALATLRTRQAACLIILGEGPERARLMALVQELGLESAVAMPGFVTTPQAWIAKASVLVCSSLWEGFGNTLVEALAVGTPVVSTDCPGGPRYILDDGRYGRLAAVGNAAGLATALEQMLADERDPQMLQRRAADFSVESIASQYLRLLASHTPPSP